MTDEVLPSSTFFPALNAFFNACSLVCLLVGYYFIKIKKEDAHKKWMGAAFIFSSCFLSSYLYYHFNFQAAHFQGTGFIRPLYYGMLISHIILAVVILPFILSLLYFALKKNFARHKKIARWIWPAWIYTSLTGVLIYLCLYHFYPAQGVSP